MPELNRLWGSLADGGIDLIGFNVDAGPQEKSIRSFLEKTPVDYPVFLGGTKTIEQTYTSEETTVPLSILVDEKGRVK